MLVGTFFFINSATRSSAWTSPADTPSSSTCKKNQANQTTATGADDALLAHGATRNDLQVRELSRPNQLRIQLGMSMEEKDHPFYQMPETFQEGIFDYPYQSNPRLAWVVNALEKGGLEVQASQLAHLNQDWNVMSGQLSDTMRNNAIIALGVALLSILLNSATPRAMIALLRIVSDN